jgi:tetratricopeptide (TPR) repeat protein
MTDPLLERIKSLELRLAKNPQSPLFARLADYYRQVGRSKDALRLCDDGLASYPYYTTGHLVKAKVLTQLGMTAEARHAYEIVREFLPTNESVMRLTSIIDHLPLQEPEVAWAVEEPVEPEPAQSLALEIVQEEVVVEEPQPTAIDEPQESPIEEVAPQEPVAVEEPTPQAEEPPVQEFITEEPLVQEFVVEELQPIETAEAGQAAEDSFEFGEQPVAEPQPEEASTAENLGLSLQPEPPQPYEDLDFGAPPEEPAVAAVEETPFGSQPIEEPPWGVEPEPAQDQVQEPAPPEPPAIEAAPATSEPVQAASPETSTEQTPDWFEAFGQLPQPASEAAETPESAPAEEENPSGIFGTEQSSATADGDEYEEFTARVRIELFGTEDSITLEDYLAQIESVEPPVAAPDNIGELAEKLKTSQRITPPVINFSEKAPRSTGEADTAGGSGFVTPTLAEIYVKQGWFDDAIKAYRALAANKPAEKEKFEQRIAEIEEMKKQ